MSSDDRLGAPMQPLTFAMGALLIDLLGLAAGAESMPDSWQARPVRGFELPRLAVAEDDGWPAVRLAGAEAAGWWSLRLEDPVSVGRLTWAWRVLTQPIGADLRDSATDDSALRVFVVFGPPRIQDSSTRAIFYTWGNSEPSGFRSAAHRTDRFHVIRLAGSGDVGPAWRSEDVDPFRDYRRIWRGAAPPVSAIGFMQDTDQTRRSAVSELRGLRWQPAKSH